jgi:pimeloyl-ACP methyl ester carboxylesterase
MDFLERASDTLIHSATCRPIQSLRAAMGIRTVTGWYKTAGGRIAWEESPVRSAGMQAIVCLHDAGTGGREFRPLIQRCPAECRFILIDWPGHGRSGDFSGDAAAWFTIGSCVAILDVLLRQIGVEKPILLGSGFGGAVAIRYAANYPERVMGILLCQPAGLVTAPKSGPFSQRGRRGLRNLLMRMKKAVAGAKGNSIEISAQRQALRMEALRPAMLSLRAAARDSAESSMESLCAALESLDCPTLFALSRDNHEHPLHLYMSFLDPSLAWAPKYRFTVFSGAFHPLWDEPDRFAITLTSFVQAQFPIQNHTHAWLLHAVDWPTENTNQWKCVHPDCDAERVLPAGEDANQEPVLGAA